LDLLNNIFSTRELAFIIWIVIALILINLNKGIRTSFFQVVHIFFSKRILIPFILLLIYISIAILIVQEVGLWDISLLKDSIFWIFTVAFAMYVRSNKIKNSAYFKALLLESFAWIIILEFIINFYTFNLAVELIIIPLFAFIGVLQGYAEIKRERKVEKLISNAISIFGLVLLCYIVTKTIQEFNLLFTVGNLKSFLLPLYLTLFVIPFFYVLSLFIIYEMLFGRINALVRDKKTRARLKKEIIKSANIQLNIISIISSNYRGKEPNSIEVKAFVRKLRRQKTSA
jgi:hypothetical protein